MPVSQHLRDPSELRTCPPRARSRRSRRRRRRRSRRRSRASAADPVAPDRSDAPRSSVAPARPTVTAWKIAIATTELSMNCERLNASFTDRWRRLIASASPAPTNRAARNCDRVEEEQAEEERHLAHRERVRAAPDVEVDDRRSRPRRRATATISEPSARPGATGTAPGRRAGASRRECRGRQRHARWSEPRRGRCRFAHRGHVQRVRRSAASDPDSVVTSARVSRPRPSPADGDAGRGRRTCGQSNGTPPVKASSGREACQQRPNGPGADPRKRRGRC